MFSIFLIAALVFATESDSRERRFANPPASARILPIHHCRTNDCATADAELDRLRELGFGGLVANVNFRGYLEDPACWRTFRHLVDGAGARGLQFWLYDELGYPSGTCGGKTLEGHPDWTARAFLIAVTNVPYGSPALPAAPPGKIVKAVRRPSGDGLRETVYLISDDFIWEGTHPCVRQGPFKYRYPNLLMCEPTERFVSLTHETYRKELGTSLAHVTSTFTDEPALTAYWWRRMPYCPIPVSDELLAAWRKETGRDLADDVPELLHGMPTGRTAALRHRFWSMVGERVAKNYAGTLRAWADKNGILSGGHLLTEEDFVQQVAVYGDYFKVLRTFSAPGCDMLTSIPGQVVWSTALLAGSAGDLNGSKRVMSEASDHCERSLKPRRPITVRHVVGSLNRQIWGGVNTFTSYYDWTPFSDGEIRSVNLEIGRTQTLLQDSRSAADIAVLYPTDTLMAGYEPQAKGGGGALALRTAESIRRAGAALFKDGQAFMFVDAPSLAEAEVRDGALVRGPLAWRVVILPHVTVLPAAAAKKLERFRRAGGLVLALGVLPDNTTDEFPSPELRRVTSEWMLVADENGIVAALGQAGYVRALEVESGRAGALRVARRRSKEGESFLVANDTRESWKGQVRLAGAKAVRVWDPRLGTGTPTGGRIALDLPPYAAVVLTLEKD